MSGDNTSNASDDGSPFDWCQVDHELTVRDRNKIILKVNPACCVLADGTTLPAHDIKNVVAHATEDDPSRSIEAILFSGESVILIDHLDLHALADPTYNRNDFLYETAWLGTLRKAIARIIDRKGS